jgi:hypothetical protein
MRTNTNKQRRQRDGRYLDDIVEDGGSVRVHAMLCDSAMAGHRPGYWVRPMALSDLDRLRAMQARSDASDARQEMIDRAAEAWRGERKVELSQDSSSSPSIRAPSIKARDAYVTSLADAWRTPFSLPRGKRDSASGPGPAATAPPTLRPRAPERPVPGDGAEPDNSTPIEELAARREATFQEYSTMISNAWRNPPGRRDPGAAGRIERTREVVHGGR